MNLHSWQHWRGRRQLFLGSRHAQRWRVLYSMLRSVNIFHSVNFALKNSQEFRKFQLVHF